MQCVYQLFFDIILFCQCCNRQQECVRYTDLCFFDFYLLTEKNIGAELLINKAQKLYCHLKNIFNKTGICSVVSSWYSSMNFFFILKQLNRSRFLSAYSRTFRPRIGLTASVSRTRCACSVSAPSTAWRKKSWQLPSTNSMWIRRSSRRACSTRNPQATSAVPSSKPF